MRIVELRVEHRRRPPSPAPVRDALQTLSGGGSVEVAVAVDDGVTGRSSTAFGRVDGAPRALAVLIEEVLGPRLAGRDPAAVGEIVEDLKRETEYHGHGGLTRFAIAAVDTALWDLLGKAHGAPCYRLWGAYRDRLPAYPMVGWLNYDLDELRGRCLEAVEHGFRGVKMKVGAPTLEEDVERVEAVRREIGAEVKLMVDANQALSLPEALRRGQVFAELGLEWFEEPIPAHDLDGYAELTAALAIPVATEENLYGREEFLPFFARRACRIVQPDLRRAGGPTELRAVAAMAAGFGLPYASHGGGPAALSVLLCAPTAVWLETGVPRGADAHPRLEDGCALAPTGPGFQWS